MNGSMDMNDTNSSEICWNRLSTLDIFNPIFILHTILLTILNIMVVVGNGLVILAVLRCRRLRNVAGLLIASLAMADFLVGLTVLPFAAINQTLGIWIFDSVWCHVWMAVDVWMCTSSIYNLLVIALDRFVAVTRPLNYRSLVTRRRAFVIIGCAWLLSFLISFPPMIVTWPEAFSRNLLNCQCTPMDNSPAYIIYSSTGSFHLPFVVIFYLYYRIYLTVRDATSSASRGYVSVRNSDTTSCPMDTGSMSHLNNYHVKSNHVADNADGTPSPSSEPTKVANLESVVLRIHRGKYTQAQGSTQDISSKKHITRQRTNSLTSLADDLTSMKSSDHDDIRNGSKLNTVASCVIMNEDVVNSLKPPKIVTFPHSDRDNHSQTQKSLSSSANSPRLVIKSKLRDQFNISKKYQRKMEIEIKAVKTVGVVTFCFVVCWLGFSVIYTLQAFSFCQGENQQIDCVPQFIFAIFFWMGYANSAVNPLIYAACNRQYRQAFKEILVCKYLRNRSSSLSTIVNDKSTSYIPYDESMCQ